LIDIQDNVL